MANMALKLLTFVRNLIRILEPLTSKCHNITDISLQLSLRENKKPYYTQQVFEQYNFLSHDL